MSFDWNEYVLSDVIAFNPKEELKKGISAKKIAMEGLQPFVKKIHGFTIADYSGGAKFRNGDTLLARITPCLENGKTAYVDILKQNEIAFGSTEFIVMRAIPGKTDEVFVYYLASSPAFRAVAIQSMTGTSGRQRVQNSLLENANFRMPAIEEQRAIGRALSALDDKIELNNRINKTLEEMAQALFKRWFVDFEFPDENDQPYKSSGGEMEESELGLIPKGWNVNNIGNCSRIVTRGIAPKYADKSSKYVINQKCIRDGFLDIKLARQHDGVVTEEKQLRSGDVLINSTGVGTLGRIAQVWEKLDQYTVDSHVTIVRPNLSNGIGYMGCLLKTMQSTFESAATGSTGQTELGREIIKQMKIVIPNNIVIEEFEKISCSVYNKIVQCQNEHRLLTSLRDALLPKLMSGEIRIPIEEETADV